MLDNTLFKINARETTAFSRTTNTARKLQTSTNNSFASQLNDAISKNKKPVDKNLMDVCHEMESIFVGKMLKEMRQTVHKNEWTHGGFAEEIFEDMLYDEYALNVSKNGNLGLAKMLYDEMSRTR